MEIKEINDKVVWESFAASFLPNTFLQSWGWGEYQKLSGNKIFRLGLFEKGTLKGVCLASLIKAKKGPFLYCQHGPLIDWRNKGYLEVFLSKLKDLGKREGAWFIRLTPQIEDTSDNQALFKSLAFVKAPVHNVDAQITLVLDLSPDREFLLKNIRKSTRYEIKKAQKAGVNVYSKKGGEALKGFYSLYCTMQKRQKFIPYPYERFEKEFQAFSPLKQQEIFFAEYKDKILASAIINFYGETAFYDHGASLLNHSVSTSHLLQWEVIEYARKKGYRFYNLWGGIAPNERHPWWGITVFKKGFGGKQINYIHAQDLPLGRGYYLAYIIERIYRRKRGL